MGQRCVSMVLCSVNGSELYVFLTNHFGIRYSTSDGTT